MLTLKSLGGLPTLQQTAANSGRVPEHDCQEIIEKIRDCRIETPGSGGSYKVCFETYRKVLDCMGRQEELEYREKQVTEPCTIASSSGSNSSAVAGLHSNQLSPHMGQVMDEMFDLAAELGRNVLNGRTPVEPSPFLQQQAAPLYQQDKQQQQQQPGSSSSFLSRLMGHKPQDRPAGRFNPKVFQQYASNVQEL